MESLAMARGFQDVASDDIYPDAEKAIKQVSAIMLITVNRRILLFMLS